MIEADGMVATCEPLTQFCLAALMVPGQGQALVEVKPLVPPGHHVLLFEQAEALLVQHLTR